MIRNYLKIAFRNFKRHRLLSTINLIGLSIGLACCLLIAMYVLEETGYDRFHKKEKRIARVTMEFSFDGEVTGTAVTGNKVFPAFKRNFPEVENGVRLFDIGATVKYGDKTFEENRFVYADSTLFDVFSFRLLQGDPRRVLEQPRSVVISQSSARKYFGSDNPVGKTLRINNADDYLVTGIVQDCPTNSQIRYDFFASWSSQVEMISRQERWWNANYYTYLLLRDEQSIATLEKKIPAYMQTQNEENGLKGKNYMVFHLEPLRSVHLHSKVSGGFEPAGDVRYVYIFSAVALLILIIACANYMNLVTARVSERAREVGIRKVMGALRKQLYWQFLGESLITVVLSLIIALAFVKLAIPVFNFMSSKEIAFGHLAQPSILILMLLTVVLVGIAGGGYPAMILSGYLPIKVLKGNFKTSVSGVGLRKFLIVTQFVISVGLIICTLIINSQLRFIQHKRLGYSREHVLAIELNQQARDKISTIRTEMLSNPEVRNISICTQTPTFIPGKFSLALDGRDMIVTAEGVDKEFLNTLDIGLSAGSPFTETDQANAQSEDQTLQNTIMINESASKLLGWKPTEAIGKMVDFQGRKSLVKAVIKDFHFASLHETISPLVLFLNGYNRTLLVKLSGKDLTQTIAFLENKWNSVIPSKPFQYQFLDEQFNKLYAAEMRTGKIFYAFAILAIFLACLGLFGLASFVAQQRTREIGIRKVLGASVAGIVALLSKDFLKLVFIALIIAIPLAWYGMHVWLQDFAYRVGIGWWIFLLAGGLSLFVAWVTIGIQAFRAGRANPVESLRSE